MSEQRPGKHGEWWEQSALDSKKCEHNLCNYHWILQMMISSRQFLESEAKKYKMI